MISFFVIISLAIGHRSLPVHACTGAANAPLSLGERTPENVQLQLLGSPGNPSQRILNPNSPGSTGDNDIFDNKVTHDKMPGGKESNPNKENERNKPGGRVCRPIDTGSPGSTGSKGGRGGNPGDGDPDYDIGHDPKPGRSKPDDQGGDGIGHDPRGGRGSIKAGFPDEITHDKDPSGRTGGIGGSDKKSGAGSNGVDGGSPNGNRIPGTGPSGPSGLPGGRGGDDLGDGNGIGDQKKTICPPGWVPVDRPGKNTGVVKIVTTVETPTTRRRRITTTDTTEPAFITEPQDVKTTGVTIRTTKKKRPKTTTPSDEETETTQSPGGAGGAGGHGHGGGAGGGGGGGGNAGGAGPDGEGVGGASVQIVPPISKLPPSPGPVVLAGGSGVQVPSNPPSPPGVTLPGFQPPGFEPPFGQAVLPPAKVPQPVPANNFGGGGALFGSPTVGGGYGGGGYDGGGYGDSGGGGGGYGTPTGGASYGPSGDSYGGQSYAGPPGPSAPPTSYGGGDSYGSPGGDCGSNCGQSGSYGSSPSSPGGYRHK